MTVRTIVACPEPERRPGPYVTWGAASSTTANTVRVDWVVINRVR